jgi:hypothetical protein
MQGALRIPDMTKAEYLAFEETSPEKHEFAGAMNIFEYTNHWKTKRNSAYPASKGGWKVAFL